jgi:hypothetical protein
VALGDSALYATTTGSNNTAVGGGALTANTTASNNTAVGRSALTANTTGADNIAVGSFALDASTTGYGIVAIGHEALTADTKGDYSVAIGYEALKSQNFTTPTNTYNVAVGSGAGLNVTTGINNTLIGGLAGEDTTTGHSNTMVGQHVGGDTTTGHSNTFLGFAAANYNVLNTTGLRNVIVGAYSRATAADADGAMVLGYDVAGAAGYTTLGSGTSDIRAAHGVATWNAVSDERYKKDIVDSEAGLSLINALRPRTFKYKTLGELPETFNAYKAGSTEVFKNTQTNHGFIAQEVKAAIDADSSIKDGFRLWDERDDGSQEVGEAALIPVLVKAIQELSAQNAALTARIAALESN